LTKKNLATLVQSSPREKRPPLLLLAHGPGFLCFNLAAESLRLNKDVDEMSGEGSATKSFETFGWATFCRATFCRATFCWATFYRCTDQTF
jgi:hypothetical protein